MLFSPRELFEHADYGADENGLPKSRSAKLKAYKTKWKDKTPVLQEALAAHRSVDAFKP